MAPQGAVRFPGHAGPTRHLPGKTAMDIVDDLRVHLGYLSRTVLLQVRDHDVRRDDRINAETEGRWREDDGSAARPTSPADRSPAAGRGRRVP